MLTKIGRVFFSLVSLKELYWDLSLYVPLSEFKPLRTPMELFCQSPIAQEKSRDLSRMGCLLSVNTFLVTLQFPQRGVQFVSSSLLSTC